eukprot:COSAG03_NODE_19768_length_330_cov_0.900433_1_plen_23_part_01
MGGALHLCTVQAFCVLALVATVA